MKTLFYTSREGAKHYKPPEGSTLAVISITDPKLSEAILPPAVDVIRLKFHDADRGSGKSVVFDGTAPEELIYFEDDLVTSLIEFIERNLNVDIMMVHCEGGISRSAAVAKFILDLPAVDLPVTRSLMDNYELYNRHIYTTLRNRYFGLGYGGHTR